MSQNDGIVCIAPKFLLVFQFDIHRLETADRNERCVANQEGG